MWRLYTVTAKLLALTILTITSIFLPVKRLTEVKIVIVGSGASGIAAATRLMEHGIDNIIILEAENRIGGRMNTVKLGDSVIELGCQWVHGEEGNVVFSMASKQDLLMQSVVHDGIERRVYIDSAGHLVNRNDSEKFFNIFGEIDASIDRLANYTESLGTFFNHEYFRKVEEESLTESYLVKPFLDWMQKAHNILDSADSWFETSSETEYKICEGGLTWAWKYGYSTVLDLLMKKIPDPSKELLVKNKMKLNTEVVRIKWDNLAAEENKHRIIVECSDGSGYIADHVIVTASLGVLKKRAQSIFQPKLPAQKLKAVKGLGFGTVDKIFLKFPYKWWPYDIAMFDFLWTNGNNSCTNQSKMKNCWIQGIIEFTAVDNQPLVLCGWLTGAAARYMEHLSDEEVKQESVQILNRFVGKAYNISVPLPDTIIRTSWSSNPHFYGSYSFRSMETQALQTSAAQLAKPVTNGNGRPVLLFAGEATHSYYYSTVHGAVETGWREADRLLKFFESEETTDNPIF